MRYVHFTTPARAKSIVRDGLIRKSNLSLSGAFAVPEGGYYLPWLQRWDSKHEYAEGDRREATRDSKRAAVVFETDRAPIQTDKVQAIWLSDLPIRNAKVLCLREAKKLLDVQYQHLSRHEWPADIYFQGA